MGVSGQIGVHALLNQTVDLDFGPAAFPVNYTKNWDVTSGVGANQADEVYTKTRSLATAANEDLDLSGTGLQNAFGANIAFVKVKAIIVEALGSNTTNLTVGNAAATAFVGPFGAATHTVVLKPGDWCAFGSPGAAGWAVAPASTDLLRVTNAAGATAQYKIVLVGTKS